MQNGHGSPPDSREGSRYLPKAEQDALLGEAWTLASRIDFASAYRRFEELGEEGRIPQARIDLGKGVALLNLPPKSEARIDRAKTLLESVAEKAPSEDERAMALFYLARIEHLHYREPNYGKAEELYARVADEYPEHFLGQFGRLKSVAMKLLLKDFGPDASVDACVAKLDAEAENISDPRVRRSLGRVFAEELILHEGSLETALDYALMMDRLHLPRADARSYARYRVIMLAIETGQWEIAKAAILRYLDDYPRSRKVLIEDKLAEVEAALARREEKGGERSDG